MTVLFFFSSLSSLFVCSVFQGNHCDESSALATQCETPCATRLSYHGICTILRAIGTIYVIRKCPISGCLCGFVVKLCWNRFHCRVMYTWTYTRRRPEFPGRNVVFNKTIAGRRRTLLLNLTFLPLGLSLWNFAHLFIMFMATNLCLRFLKFCLGT